MSDADLDPLYATLRRTAAFAWEHLLAVVAISAAWFLAALPIVTVGPATVGAYRAVLSLREGDGVDVNAVLGTVRSQFVHATLIALAPLVLAGTAANYALAYLATGVPAAGLLAFVTGLLSAYVWLVSVPTLIGLASGRPVTAALADGYLWTATHAMAALALGVVTAALFVVTSLLTVAVVLVFAGVAFAFHVEFVLDRAEADGITTTSTPTHS